MQNLYPSAGNAHSRIHFSHNAERILEPPRPSRIRIETRSTVSFWNPDRRVIKARARPLCGLHYSEAEVWGSPQT